MSRHLATTGRRLATCMQSVYVNQNQYFDAMQKKLRRTRGSCNVGGVRPRFLVLRWMISYEHGTFGGAHKNHVCEPHRRREVARRRQLGGPAV